MKIPLYYWNGKLNFGDALSSFVVESVSGMETEWVDEQHSKKLVAVGSVLDKAKAGDTVWGSGVHPLRYQRYLKESGVKNGIKNFIFSPRISVRGVNFLAVRGVITRDLLLSCGASCPAIFGDPGLLLPKFYTPSVSRRNRVGFVPHYNDSYSSLLDLFVIDVERDWRLVVDDICSCDLIVSSSLHGLVIADAYGIPSVWYRGNSGEGLIKYFDYYSGINIAPQPIYDLNDAICSKVEVKRIPNLINLSDALSRWVADSFS